jgi:4-alpha-glucanotransferase
MSYSELLARAAEAQGITSEYYDIFGKRHETPESVYRALLESVGFPAATESQIEAKLQQRAEQRWQHAVEPTIVAVEGDASAEAIVFRIDNRRNSLSMKLEIEWEGGELEHHWYFIPELAAIESTAEFVAKRLPLPRKLRLGYHKLRVYLMKEPQLELLGEARFIVCPQRALGVDQRIAGLGVSLYGLRSYRNWGFGDFSDLYLVIDSFAAAGAQFIALNPLHAIANRSPYNTSPYLPECAFYRNFLYLDVEKIGDPRLSDEERAEIAALRASEFVEYERVARLKLAALGRIFAGFGGSAEFDAYLAQEGQPLQDYATYCALDEEMHGRDGDVWLWTQWPEEYRDPRSAAVGTFAEERRDRVRFFAWLQWNLVLQGAEVQAYARGKGMQIGLYHDLALATDRFGADLWANREFYVTRCRVGAPPDDFSPSGQDWSFPPPDRDAHKANGYELFARSIRQAAANGGALRIDHVMRFFRLYWIPENMDARSGAYVLDYAKDLLAILALESVRGNFVVIGEDLGTITDEMRQGFADARIHSYRLLWFERNGDGTFKRPEEYPEQALAATTTHDLPTLTGFAQGRDIEARRAAGLIDQAAYEEQRESRSREAAKLIQSLSDAGFDGSPMGFVLATPSRLAVINQEDLTGETEQQNLPGSTWQYPNWRRKMLVPVEEVQGIAGRFHELVRESGRLAGK